MPGDPPDASPLEHIGDERGMEGFVDRSDSPSLPPPYPLELIGEEEPEGCGQLERRWVLWQEFMTSHAQLDAWLLVAEQAVGAPPPTHVAYATAREEIRKFERLRCEARSRLVQLDRMTQRNRTLTRLFQGAMQARLLGSVRDCGQRWDNVNTKLESITGRLKVLVSEWEGFEAEREELALWLAELDVRLTKVDHLTGNTCEKLRHLESFQQSVCENSRRVNVLLQRGEALIQSSEATDARQVEGRLLELLRSCSLVYSNIAQTHTRLLSMRLVFEDDWILSQATDSGCPSETLLEEEGALDMADLDLPAFPNRPKFRLRPPPPPSPSSPTHEHLGLEWDPSVDIGHSVSHDEADSLYFSASAALSHDDGVKRLSYLSLVDSLDDGNDITNQEADLRWLGQTHPSVPSPVATQGGEIRPNGELWATSTPDKLDGESVGFDGRRVRAWLGVQGPAPPGSTTSSSKAVQTDVECHHRVAPNQLAFHVKNTQLFSGPTPSPSHDLNSSSHWVKLQCGSPEQSVKAEEEQPCWEEVERRLSKQSVTPSSRPPSALPPPAPLCLLLAAALALLAGLIWLIVEPAYHCSSRAPRGFHLALRYVNGPPPT
ncbi:nesprin-2 isoform X2 [Gasterosteus aculeatus]